MHAETRRRVRRRPQVRRASCGTALDDDWPATCSGRSGGWRNRSRRKARPPPDRRGRRRRCSRFPGRTSSPTNDYHVRRRPGEVIIVRWLEGEQVETFYERLQAHFDAGLNDFREEERQAQEWKQDAGTLAYLDALDELEIKLADRYLRDLIRQHNLFVLSTLTADEMDILHLCDYLMGVPAAAVVVGRHRRRRGGPDRARPGVVFQAVLAARDGPWGRSGCASSRTSRNPTRAGEKDRDHRHGGGFVWRLASGKKLSMTSLALLLIVSILCVSSGTLLASDAKPTSPDFGPNVLVFDPSMSDIQPSSTRSSRSRRATSSGPSATRSSSSRASTTSTCRSASTRRSPGWADRRTTWRSPARCDPRPSGCGTATRPATSGGAAENCRVTPTHDGNVNVWAVSQGVAMRRVHIKGDLHLWDGGWSSGGFLADSQDRRHGQLRLAAAVASAATPNGAAGAAATGTWSSSARRTRRPASWPEQPYTVIEKTPVIREKPYLFVDEAGDYFVMVPALRTDGTPGHDVDSPERRPANADPDRSSSTSPRRSRHRRHASTPRSAAGSTCCSRRASTTSTTPSASREPDTIVLGPGLSDARPGQRHAGDDRRRRRRRESRRRSCSKRATTESPTLLQVGEPGSSASHAANPIFLYDIFCRAGGAGVGMAKLLRHDQQQQRRRRQLLALARRPRRRRGWDVNKNAQRPDRQRRRRHDLRPVRRALPGVPDDLERQRRARVLLPIRDALRPADAGRVVARRRAGYASYKVADKVTTHEAWGLGVYCVFHAGPIIAETAIESPTGPA